MACQLWHISYGMLVMAPFVRRKLFQLMAVCSGSRTTHMHLPLPCSLHVA